MNKLLKLLALCFIVAVLPVAFTSCSSDDDDTEDVEMVNNLIGMWREDDSYYNDEYVIYVFNKNHTGKEIWHESIYSSGQGETNVSSFTWSLDADIIEIEYDKKTGYYDEDHLFWDVISLTKRSLLVNEFDRDHSEDYVREFYRVNSIN